MDDEARANQDAKDILERLSSKKAEWKALDIEKKREILRDLGPFMIVTNSKLLHPFQCLLLLLCRCVARTQHQG
jgi:hypothetical protein